MPKRKNSTIRAAVADRAAALGLTAGKLSRATVGTDGRPAVSEEMLRLFLAGRNPISSDRLDALFGVLGLGVGPRR